MFVSEGVSGVFAFVSYELRGLTSRLIVFCVLTEAGCLEMRDPSVGGVGDSRLMHGLGVLDDNGPFSK